MIGLLTPPVGMVLYVLQKVARISFERTVAAVLPWFIPLIGTLVLITYVPQLVLWLPEFCSRSSAVFRGLARAGMAGAFRRLMAAAASGILGIGMSTGD